LDKIYWTLVLIEL